MCPEELQPQGRVRGGDTVLREQRPGRGAVGWEDVSVSCDWCVTETVVTADVGAGCEVLGRRR